MHLKIVSILKMYFKITSIQKCIYFKIAPYLKILFKEKKNNFKECVVILFKIRRKSAKTCRKLHTSDDHRSVEGTACNQVLSLPEYTNYIVAILQRVSWIAQSTGAVEYTDCVSAKA